MISILLVDQALENPRNIRQLLSSSPHNFELNWASAYGEIVEGFHSKASDVCVIDSEMETGLKLFAQARSLGYTAPIVLVTPNDAREAIKALRCGVSDCLIRDDLSSAEIEHSVCCVVEEARNSRLHNQRERRYLALLDNASEIVYTHDLEGNFTSINRTGEQLIGYSQSEILEMNVAELVAPEYSVLFEKLISRTLDAQIQMSDEVELITKYGGNLVVEIHTHPINHDGKTFEIQGVATTPSGQPKDLPWKSRSLIEDNRSNAAREENRILSLRSYKAANSFLSQKHSARSDRSLFTF